MILTIFWRLFSTICELEGTSFGEKAIECVQNVEGATFIAQKTA